MTNSACVAIAPLMRFEISGAVLASSWYCASWFVESLSHSALMSPVTIKDCAPFHSALSR